MPTIEDGRRGAVPLIARVKGILVQPATEWDRIAAEPTTIAELYTGYLLILAAIGPFCRLLGSLVFGYSLFGVTWRPSIGAALTQAVLGYALSLGGAYGLALIVDALAPTFQGTRDRTQAFKVVAYSWTAAMLAGAFALIPALSILGLVGLYSLYLMYLGLPKLMRAPAEKAVPYTVLVVLVSVVVFIVVGVVVGSVIASGPGPMGRVTSTDPTARQTTGSIALPGGGTLDLGALQAATAKLAMAGQQMAGQAGSTAVQPVATAALQGLLPDRLPGGYGRSEISSASGGAMGISGAQAEARYTRSGASIVLDVTDMGAAGALAALGSALAIQTDKQTATGYERAGKVDGRMTLEEWDGTARSGKYGVLVADRFMIQAEGQGATMDELEAAVGAVGFTRLEVLAKSNG